MKKIIWKHQLGEAEYQVYYKRDCQKSFAMQRKCKAFGSNKALKKALVDFLTREHKSGDVNNKEWLLRSVLDLTNEPVMFYYLREDIVKRLQEIDNPCKVFFLKHFL